ncbi:MAG: lipopolysaccharide biosynthesis protein [Bacteroidales bacterium]
MEKSFKKKTISGIIWSLSEKLGVQGIRFILGILMARLLMPADYGLIGMLTVFFAISSVLVDGGFSVGLIQIEKIDKQDESSVFYFNIIISLLLYFLFWFMAPQISTFYGQEELNLLTKILSLNIIINAFYLVQGARLQRKMDFKLLMKLRMISASVSGVTGVILAYKGFGVWSLVVQTLLGSFILTILCWISVKWVPELNFNINSIKKIFSFSSKILLTNLSRSFFDNIYLLIIGKVFQPQELGFYTKSKQFQELPVKNISVAISAVTFSAYSRMQTDPRRMKNAAKKTLLYTYFFFFPLMFFLIGASEPLIILLLTEKWATIIPYFQLLCLGGMLHPFNSVNINLLVAKGRSDLNLKISFIKDMIRIINIVITYRWGIMAIIIGETLIQVISLFINTYFIKRLFDYSLIEQIKEVYPYFFMGIVILLVSQLINLINLNNVFLLLMQASCSALLLLAGYILWKPHITKEIFNNTIHPVLNRVINNPLKK